MANKMPSPGELGLPIKFDSWRSGQVAALEAMTRKSKRVTAISAPTGFGKSLAYVGYAIFSQVPTCIVTNSRALQTQLMKDFAPAGLVDIRGRANYSCGMRDDYTCEDGYAARCPYKGSVMCPASQAEMRAATSRLVVTNYSKWTLSKKFGTGMDHFQQVIFDEGHDAPSAVASAMQVILHHKEIEQDLKLEFPNKTAALEMHNWRYWASQARGVCENAMLDAQKKVVSVSDPKPAWVRQLTHMRNLLRRLSIISTVNDNNWVVDETPEGYQFDPIRPGRYAESTLFLGIPRVIITSATLRPKTLFMLGVSQNDFDFHEFDSDFDPNRCPTYYVPTMRVDVRAGDLSPLWTLFDQIAARRKDRKGLAHTISYARTQELIQGTRFRDQVMTNPKGEGVSRVLEAFKKAPPGKILVSPSIGTGYDFQGKEAEWQFICKIPFPDGRSKVMKARQEDDKEYGPYLPFQDFVQMVGRIMRSKQDQGETFIGDMHMDWFRPRYRHLAPKSFHQFYRVVDVLPDPPERLP